MKLLTSDHNAMRNILISKVGRMSPWESDPLRREQTSWSVFALAALLVLISVWRIVSTYRIFSQVWDEPAHIACGLQWWQQGVYKLEPQHPPLSRIFFAAPLYFKGVRLERFADKWQDGNAALTFGGNYSGNLRLARIGNLPFWIAACLFLFLLAKQTYDQPTALLATLFFTTLPPMLALAGLAYTDTALVAGMLCFAWRWIMFLEKPNVANSVGLGLSISFAILTKYSAIPYMAVTGLLTGLLAVRHPRLARAVAQPGERLKKLGLLVMIIFVAFVTTWACFRFSLQPISMNAGHRHPFVDARVGSSGLLHNLVYWAIDTPLPLREVHLGVKQVADHARNGHLAYNFGKIRRTGTPYYYMALFIFTVPVGFLLLLILSAVFLWNARRRVCVRLQQQIFLTVLVAVVLVNACSSINIGYRHNLLFYALMCLLAAAGCRFVFASKLMWARSLVLLFIVQHVGASVLAHPNYHGYFNILAMNRPEEICVSSLGGGDEWRLAARLRERGISHIHLALDPPLPIEALGFPSYSLSDGSPSMSKGWLAVGVYHYFTAPERFGWLRRYRPVERIGKTIMLYYIDDGSTK